MARRVKHFNNHSFDKDLRNLEIKMAAYNSYIYNCSQIKEGASSLDEVEKYLNQKTGFVNPRMSADAMGVLEPYTKAVELENNFMGIDMSALEESTTKSGRKIYKIRTDYIDLLKDRHTTYYTSEQSKSIDALEKAIKSLNQLETPFKSALMYNNREQEWVWSKQHTDNSLIERRVSKNRASL